MNIFLKNNYQFLTILTKELIKKGLIPKDPKILDFGCGRCELLKNLKKEIPSATLCGVDIYMNSKEFQDLQSFKKDFHIKDIRPYEKFSFDTKFDLIITNQVLEHIENLKKVYNHFDHILSKEGRIIACFPVKEIYIEPHLKIPFVHWIKKSSKLQKIYIYIFNHLRIENIIKFGFNKRKYIQKINSDINFCNQKIFYLRMNENIKLIKQYFSVPLDLSDKVNFYFRKNSKLTNLLKVIIKSIPLKSLRLFLSSRLIGSIFLINKKKIK